MGTAVPSLENEMGDGKRVNLTYDASRS